MLSGCSCARVLKLLVCSCAEAALLLDRPGFWIDSKNIVGLRTNRTHAPYEAWDCVTYYRTNSSLVVCCYFTAYFDYYPDLKVLPAAATNATKQKKRTDLCYPFIHVERRLEEGQISCDAGMIWSVIRYVERRQVFFCFFVVLSGVWRVLAGFSASFASFSGHQSSWIRQSWNHPLPYSFSCWRSIIRVPLPFLITLLPQ